jgi:predicted RNase H-like nuclease (RuvC/YqgF family)
MPAFPSMISLHLRYRIWIAELNLDINLIRIYKDYLNELTAAVQDNSVGANVRAFEQTLENYRTEIDELKNDLHLLKMKLAAYTRKQKVFDHETYKADDHAGIKQRYTAFRKKFDTLKNELSVFVTAMHP